VIRDSQLHCPGACPGAYSNFQCRQRKKETDPARSCRLAVCDRGDLAAGAGVLGRELAPPQASGCVEASVRQAFRVCWLRRVRARVKLTALRSGAEAPRARG